MLLNEKGMGLLEHELRILGQEFEAAVLGAVRAVETMQEWYVEGDADPTRPVPPNLVMAAIRAHDRASGVQKRMSGMLRAVHIITEAGPDTEADRHWCARVELLRTRSSANLRLLETCKAPLAAYR